VTSWNTCLKKITFGCNVQWDSGAKAFLTHHPQKIRSMHDKGMIITWKTGEAKIFNRLWGYTAFNKNWRIISWSNWDTRFPIKQGRKNFSALYTRYYSKARKQKESSLQIQFERFWKVTEATNDAIWGLGSRETQLIFRSKSRWEFFGKETSGIFPEHEIWAKDAFHHRTDLCPIKHSFLQQLLTHMCKRWGIRNTG